MLEKRKTFQNVRVESVTEESPDFEKVKALYRRAFPSNERIPMEYLLSKKYDSNFLSFHDGDLFCGFACLLSNGNLTLLLYLAIDDAMRGEGYGTIALDRIRNMKPGHLIFADIELETAEADNNDQRNRRKQFYLRNGFKESSIHFQWEHELFEIVVSGGELTEDDVKRFWKDFK